MALSKETERFLKIDAEEYSFNIRSELFDSLTDEQKLMWKKETEIHFSDGFRHAIDLAKRALNQDRNEKVS